MRKFNVVCVDFARRGEQGPQGPEGPPGPEYTFDDFAARTFWAGPVSGLDAPPSERLIVLTDLPEIDGLTLLGNPLPLSSNPVGVGLGEGLGWFGTNVRVVFGNVGGTVCEGNDPRLSPIWRRLNAPHTVDHTITTFQDIFPAPNSVSLEADTLYEFLLLVAGKYAGDPATVTAHAIQFQFLESVAGVILGGATLFDGRRSASGGLGANNGTWAWTDTLLTPLSMTAGSVTTGLGFAYRACGSIRTGNAGSITPQFRFTPNAPGTAFELSDGTMMIIRKLGPSSSVGNW